ncbi:MAG: DUF3034 family protein, partial [Xanthomonadaceae bacterium]|nr:DUF3034 family protein [Xanthomonadaceae bacterium]
MHKFRRQKMLLVGALVLAGGLVSLQAAAADGGDPPENVSGKLLLTGGVSQIEGSAGGGLTPWALIGSYGTQGQFG